jgi:hypothetical protein
MGVTACNNNPAGPDETKTNLQPLSNPFNQQGDVPAGTSTPVPEQSEKAEYTISNDGEIWTVEMHNTSGWKHGFGAACYIDGDAPIELQKVVEPYSYEQVANGKRTTLEAMLACGRVHQCDFVDCPILEENPDYGGCVIEAKRVVANDCPPPPPKCVKKDCPWGYYWDPELCKCVKIPECLTCENSKESIVCEVNSIDKPTTIALESYEIVCKIFASHIGYVTSNILIPPPAFTGLTEISATAQCGTGPYFVNLLNRDLYCKDGTPVNQPGILCGSDNANIIIPTCKLQECPEKPPAQCDTQKWLGFPDCRWVGQCDSDCPEYELPVTWCHVSSKKQGGIIETTMNHNVQIPPGHCKHFDPNKWCPPDYLGTCNGRSFSYQCK